MSNSKCSICMWEPEQGTDADFEAHKKSSLHRVNYLKYFYDKNKHQMLCNKKGVEISCVDVHAKNNIVSANTSPGKGCTLTLAIKNNEDDVMFMECEFLHKLACRWSISDENQVTSTDRGLRIPKGYPDPYNVKLIVTPDYVGIYQSPLMFQFQREGEPTPFYMGLIIQVTCTDEIVDLLQQSAPYTARMRTDVQPHAKTIHRGIPPRSERVVYAVPLTKFKIEPELRESIEKLQVWFKHAIYVDEESRNIDELVGHSKELYLFLLKQLQASHYTIYFNLLLNFEEVQMDIDIRKYDMKNVTMYTNTNYPGLLSLRVLGLAEKRPSVLKGDKLFVRIVGEKLDVEYEGVVHIVHETDAILGFGPKLMQKYLKNMKFNVRFEYSKFPLYVMLRALTCVEPNHVKHWFFPDEQCAAKCTTIINPTNDFVFYNRQIENNLEQSTAIKNIVAGSSLPAPYLLHGPPGTGKTITVVEAILQVWKLCRQACILVCTPSNSASDLIAERLLAHIKSCDIYRFYSFSRDYKAIPEKIREKKCLNYDAGTGTFFIPKKQILTQYKVVVSTLCNSSKLISLGIEVGHFTHIFLDESGHALEPEAITPLVGLLKCRTTDKGYVDFGGQLVLAGDPMQLGPVIRCRVADEFKLGISLLERLMKLPIYQKKNSGNSSGQFDERLLTRLKNNYRSHPAILDLPNQLFYEGELRVFADQLQRESLCHWEGLPNVRFPVLFHGVLGKDIQEAKNPSFFNPQEVSVVIAYVDRLVNARTNGLNIRPKEIGIISPYRQQVYKIRNELSKRNLTEISVGSVDEFQGQERRVIVISTVRSSPDLMTYDMNYKLGFLKNPKRFNVALTRAKSLLIVIGNPNLLSKDYHWNQFLLYCRGNGSYVGASYDLPEDEIDDVLSRFNKLNLLPVEREEVRISHRANQEDPEWKHDY